MSLLDDRLRRLTRLFLITTTLHAGGHVTLQSLAAVCGCHRRTILRDLSFLEEAGVACHYDPRRRSYVLDSPPAFLTVPFSLPEAMALGMAQEATLALAGAALEPALHAAFEKVIRLVPPRLRSEIETARQAVAFEMGVRRDYSSAPWQVLLSALRLRQTVEMDYYSLSQDRTTTRRMDPYYLVLRQGFWNVVGHCHTRKEVRLFALDGIRSLRLTGETFVIPADFSLAEYLRGSVGVLRGETQEILVRFEPSVARWVKRRKWSFPCTLVEEADGSVLLRGTVSGLAEISRELLRWGALVTALEPPELRAMLRIEAEAIARKYQEEASQ